MISFVALMLISAAGDPPLVRHVTKVVTRSWQPLELADVERIVESSALAELGKKGAMRLERSTYAELKSGEYTLVLDGRFIEEAEKFSVYLTFGPGTRTDLPSFHVSDTESLGGLQRAVMQKKIEDLSRRAAARLAEVLAPRLESVRLRVEPPPIEAPELPWTWGAIEAPRVTSPTKVMKDLLDVRNEDHVRHQALAAIRGQVFDQPAARDVVMICVLRDPSPKLRASCAEALAPVARAHVPTQRLILHAMRSEIDDSVVSELATLSQGFVGLSRKECIETWLELVSSDATPAQSADNIARLLAEEGDVPNLDLAIAKCLQQEALAGGKTHACASSLLRVVPKERRKTIVAKYLERVQVWEQGEANTFGAVRDHLVGHGGKVDAATAELYLSIAERRSGGQVRDDALFVAMRHEKPTPAVIERVLKIAHEPKLTNQALRAIDELVRTSPELTAMTVGALEQLEQRAATFVRQSYGGDPRDEIKKTVARLKQAADRRR